MAGPGGVIRIPYLPREQFLSFHNRQQRFACLVCHRRAGKTVASIHDLQRGALRSANPSPRFAYLAPYRSQAKAVAWDYLRKATAPLADLGASLHESELRADYHNGGQVRLYGADNADALRGIYLDGVVLDEFADMDPRVWPEIIRPALADRKGWAVFIGTPRGKNAFYDIWKDSQEKSDWFSLMLKASETKLIDAEELQAAKSAMTEEQYAQEFECSFDAAIQGAYYGRQMAAAESEGRVCGVPYEPSSMVWTAWDLGIGDPTAIWFAQRVGREVHIIDYYESSGVDLAHYVSALQQKSYQYAGHILPHDAQAKELGTGKSRMEVLEELGLRNITIAPQHRVEDGISSARLMLPRCWFDAKKCDFGIEALKQYRTQYDEKRKTFSNAPLHDWTSHAADAFRYLAQTFDRVVGGKKNFDRKIEYGRLGII